MYTQCPECGSAFRVTAEVLKQAAGMVRCGSCGHAFNSLEYLSEQKPGETQPEPEPSIPELKPEPQQSVEPDSETEAPQSISAEQSAALLKTLDQLAGDEIVIEDTGVEWRVLGNEDDSDDDSETAFDPSETDVSHLDADTEIDFSDSDDVDEKLVESDNTGIWIVGDSRPAGSEGPGVFDDPTETIVDETEFFDSGSTKVDQVLEGTPTPVDEVLEAGGTNIENAELFQTQMMGTTPPDTNAELFQTQAMSSAPAQENAELFETQTMGTATSAESADLFQTQQIDPPIPETADDVEAPAEQMRFDDNTPLPDDFLDDEVSAAQPPDTAPPAAEDVHTETHAERQSPIALSEPDEWEQLLDEFDELLATDLDSASAVNGSVEAATVDSGGTSIEDDLMSAAFENDQPDSGLGKDLDASIEEDLMTAAFDIEEAEDKESSNEDKQIAEAADGEEAAAESTTDDELGEAASDDVASDQKHEPVEVEARADDEADPAAEQEFIEAEAQADDVASHFAETSAELGDVLDEASRLAESLDDESGRFKLDGDEAVVDTDVPGEERRSGSPGDESIAEELRAIDEASAAHELGHSEDEAPEALSDESSAEEAEERALEAQAEEDSDAEQLEALDEETDAGEAEEDERQALDVESGAENVEEDELAALDDESAAEADTEGDGEEKADEELAPSDVEDEDSVEATDDESDADEKLDLSTILDPDDEGLVDEGEADPDRSDDDLPELHDVGDHDRPKHHVPPMTEEEETINRLIDQDLLAIAQVDDEGFTSTIVVDESAAPIKVETETVIIGDPDERELPAEGQVGEAIELTETSTGIFGLGTAKSTADSEPGRGRTAGIAAVLALLSIGLAGQFVHQNRESLATNATFASILNPVYDSMGMPITPNWDVSGWDIARTQGATDEQDQLLTIFSEIRNTSETALPYPVVTLSLTDRYQDSIGALILEPGDYLATGKNADGLVPPGGKFEAVIPINEPSAEAVGYTINACYRTPSSDLRCAISDFK
ncbi:MAG: DUF3426 domain-containing protein [Woeseiaceae bacterium]|nr:DUF3426 domain-containing protein [Woeseiaceae bacterium]